MGKLNIQEAMDKIYESIKAKSIELVKKYVKLGDTGTKQALDACECGSELLDMFGLLDSIEKNKILAVMSILEREISKAVAVHSVLSGCADVFDDRLPREIVKMAREQDENLTEIAKD